MDTTRIVIGNPWVYDVFLHHTKYQRYYIILCKQYRECVGSRDDYQEKMDRTGSACSIRTRIGRIVE